MTSFLRAPVCGETLSMHAKRLYRLAEEALEVSFILCNNEMEEFGVAKIFDVFDQIMSTAFVLNTGYWPFYNSLRGQSICVCGRFGFICRHTKNSYHWIDMQPVPEDHTGPKFYPVWFGAVYPVEYNIQVHPLCDDPMGYNIILNLRMEYKKHENRMRPNRVNNKKKKNEDQLDPKQKCATTIITRYNYVTQHYNPFFTITFQPNPFFHEYYGSYFWKLLEHRNAYQWPKNDNDKMYTIGLTQMPTTTLTLFHVNLPVHFSFSRVLVVFPQVIPVKNKALKPRKIKTEPIWDSTPIDVEEEYEKNKENNIWKQSSEYGLSNNNYNGYQINGSSQNFQPISGFEIPDVKPFIGNNFQGGIAWRDPQYASPNSGSEDQKSFYYGSRPCLTPRDPVPSSSSGSSNCIDYNTSSYTSNSYNNSTYNGIDPNFYTTLMNIKQEVVEPQSLSEPMRGLKQSEYTGNSSKRLIRDAVTCNELEHFENRVIKKIKPIKEEDTETELQIIQEVIFDDLLSMNRGGLFREQMQMHC